MRLNEVGEKYPVLKPVVERIKEVDKVDELFPPQSEAIKSGYLDGENLVLAIPTCSGKTLCAELAMLKTVLEDRKKAVYLSPLKALASEKYGEFKEKYGPLGVKVALSIGDMDKSDPWLSDYDIIITSNEKFDSLLRHNINWISDIGLAVSDEIHLLDSPNRGPTLEVVLTRLRQVCNPKILALSATISNYKDLAKWLGAKAVKSDFRPVELHKGVCFENKVNFIPKKELELSGRQSELMELVNNVLAKEKQTLIFASTRKGAEAAAEKVGELIRENLKLIDAKELALLSKKVLGALGHKTAQCDRLASCIKNGTAFHHAGLVAEQRKLIEENFKKGVIKILTATPTLSWGVNTPAHQVIIRDLKRFSSFKGMDYLPVLDVLQMCGRAGRIKYDTEGLAILLTKNKGEAEYAWENYIKGEPENIYSKLGVEPVLRMHVLSLIASEVVKTKKDLMDFFAKTFYAHQYKDLGELEKKLEKVLLLLEKFKFITSGEAEKSGDSPFKSAAEIAEEKTAELKPTRLGKRVSELYIDPITAKYITDKLAKINKGGASVFGVLQMLSNTLEMRPLLNVRKTEFEKITQILAREESLMVDKAPDVWELEYDDFLRSVKIAEMFNSWAEEFGEDHILETFGVRPGELRARMENMDWLLYATQELGLLLNYMDILKDIRKVRVRLRYGVKEELLPLVRLKGIGRIRARILFRNGVKTLGDLKKLSLESLARLVGQKTAEAVRGQLITSPKT